MENKEIDLNKRENKEIPSLFNNNSKSLLEKTDSSKIENDLQKALEGSNKKEENKEKPKGLFANLSNATKIENTTINSSLFGSQTIAGGLFGNLNNNNSKLFGENSGTGMFNNLVKDENSEDDDDKKSEKSNEFEFKNLKKDTKFVSNYDEMISFEVFNFKFDDKEGFGKGLITIEKTKEKEEYIINFRNVFKVLYTGFIIKKVSKIVKIKNKEEILSGFAFSIKEKKEEKEEDKKEDKKEIPSVVKNNFKIQFKDKEDAEKFKIEFEKYI